MGDLPHAMLPDRLGICIFPERSVRDLVDVATFADELGIGFLGVGDVHELWADPYVGLGAAATATKRVKLGPWVTNPVTRHPGVTANAMMTLNDVSGGRAVLGIGVGDGSVRLMGAKPAKLDDLASAIAGIRTSMENACERLPGPPIPIYWAAAGERSTRAGARVADGVIVSGWIAGEMLQDAVRVMAEGAGGRTVRPLQVFNTALAIDDDPEVAIRRARPYVARALARPSSAKVPGWSDAEVERFRRAYDFRRHFRADQELAGLVPNELVQKKAVAGTPLDCARLLHAVIASGFDRVTLIPVGEPKVLLERLVREVIPLIPRVP